MACDGLPFPARSAIFAVAGDNLRLLGLPLSPDGAAVQLAGGLDCLGGEAAEFAGPGSPLLEEALAHPPAQHRPRVAGLLQGLAQISPPPPPLGVHLGGASSRRLRQRLAAAGTVGELAVRGSRGLMKEAGKS